MSAAAISPTRTAREDDATVAIAKWDGALHQAMVQEVIAEQNGTAPPTVIDAEPEPEPLPHH